VSSAPGVRGALAALAAALGLACSPPADTPVVTSEDPARLYAEHRAHGAFFNPWGEQAISAWSGLRWWLTPSAFPKSAAPQVPAVPNDGRYLAAHEPGATLTWVGHATFAIHEGSDVVLTDPHFGPRALLPRRKMPPGLPLAAVPPHAFAVVSHTHYDHLDAHTVRALPDTVEWYVPLGVGKFIRGWGRRRVVELDWWQSARRGTWTITCLPSQHWSLRQGQGRNETLWCSWLLDSGRRRYYFAGDTGYFHGFREFGRRFGPIDVALLPIGAYEPRWLMRYQHLNPEEAYRAFLELRARHLLGMHWGTFDLTDEPIDLAPRALAEAVARHGGDPRVHALAIGERWRLPDP
jgi:N-acyl-phosphatidylethanolamine-hydrolysing phospholipase D